MADKLTIILDSNDLRFDYKETELIKFRNMWKEHREHTDDPLEIVNNLADELKTTPDNVFLLTLDQIRKGEIS